MLTLCVLWVQAFIIVLSNVIIDHVLSKPQGCDCWVSSEGRQNLENQMVSVIIRAIINIIISRKIIMIIGLKGDHEEGCPWFLIFPTAEETSHVDGPLSCSVVKKFAVLLWDQIQHLVKSKCGGPLVVKKTFPNINLTSDEFSNLYVTLDDFQTKSGHSLQKRQ